MFLFSGGGNDLVGNQFCIWLKDYKAGMQATDMINSERFNAVLEIVQAGYCDLLEIRNAESHATKVFLHSYDNAVPDGRGVCGYGPWLKPSLDFRGVPPSLQKDVVKEVLLRFDTKLRQVAAAYREVYVVPTQGTLKDEEWSNEIHPDFDGFDKLAEKFATALRARVSEI
jgi:hypothetical protein